MPSVPRSFQVGGIYHVFNRGVEKRRIYQDRADYQRFMEALELYRLVDPPASPAYRTKLHL